MKWTQEQRMEALSDLHRAAQDCDEMESYNPGVSYNSAMVDIACQRNALRDALTKIHGALNADDAESYRADDPEGAMDTAFEAACAALLKTEE